MSELVDIGGALGAFALWHAPSIARPFRSGKIKVAHYPRLQVAPLGFQALYRVANAVPQVAS